MNRHRILAVAAIGLCAAVWSYACGDGATEPPTPSPDPPRPTTVTVTPATIQLTALGATEQLTAEVRDQNGNAMAGAAVSWASSTAAVATVSATGLVTSVGNGTATITATAGSASGGAAVAVAQEVGAVAVTPAADTVVVGDTLRLAAEAADANGHPVAEAELDWASSDTLVAVVDDAGLVTGVGAGQAEVTASASGVAGRASLTIVAPAATAIAVTPDTVALTALGQTAQLAAEVRDQNGNAMAGAAVSWASSTAAVATVSATGLVTSVGNGTATITATAGSASGGAAVAVAQEVGAVAVTPAADTVVVGDTLRLAAEAADANGHPVAEAELDWASSDTLVAVVDDAGLVTGVGAGQAEVTASASGVAGRASLTIVAPAATAIAVTPDTVALTALGQTAQLAAEVRDQNGNAMAGAAVSWASSTAAVATVSATGLVTSVGNGTATITATAGSASGGAAVAVAQEVGAVAVTPAADTVVVGDTLRLAAEAADANGHPVAEAELDWASSDTLVAVVDDAGLVTGLDAGQAEVTASASGVAGRASLTVVAPAATAVAVTPDTVALTALGQTAQLAAEVRDQIGRLLEGVPVSWSSADAVIAAVDSAGLVTALRGGATTVAATAGEVSGTAVVTVIQSAGSVIVSPAADTVAPGDTLRLVAEAFDENGHLVEGAEFTWSSSDVSVATVNGAGLVTGVAEGTAPVTAAAGDASGASVITVTYPTRSVVSFATMATAIPEGDTAVLEVLLDPPPEVSFTLGYTLGIDTDVDTHDADPRDYTGGRGGSVGVGAGETTIAIRVAISDDADIEPTREVFTVALDAPDSNDGYVLGSPRSALITINEGVCDRTPQIRDEILAQATMADCTEATDEILSWISTLDFCVPDIPGYCDAGNAVRFDAITTLRGGDFQGLSRLRTLNLHANRLSELPPEVFHNLSNLRSLNLSGNRLARLPDGVFATLSGLASLNLQNNRLTELPATLLSGLSELQWVTFFRNELTRLPPGLFTPLAHPVVLDLDGNPGSPFPLTARVERVDREDAAAPGPAMLQVQLAEGAPFELSVSVSALGGTLSAETVSLAVGATASSTITLTPDTDSRTGVSATIGNVPDLQAVCEDCRGLAIVPGDPLVVADPDSLELRIPAAYVTQGVQDPDNGVPLISGRQAMLRVFVTAQAPTSVKVGGRVTFLMGAREIHSVELEPVDGRIPTSVDESEMGLSLNARVPAPVLRDGPSLVVELNPGGDVPTTSTSHGRFPLSGQLDLNVVDIPPLQLTIVPILYRSEANRQTNAVVSEFTHDLATADSRGTLPYTQTILPIGDLTVRLREPYYTSADADTGTDGIFTLLREVSMLKHLENPSGNEYYHGVFAPPARRDPGVNWSGGVAEGGGYSAVSNYVPPDLTFWILFTHELGHNLGLGHTPCGRAGGVDPDFPYPDGSIGVWGHTFLDAADPKLGRLFHPRHSRDIMGYCNDRWSAWISDYNFSLALAHRLQVESSAAAVQKDELRRTLLLWGGVREGNLLLEPAFAHDARLKLPEASGPYRLEGLDAEGRRLFSLSFRPDELDHGGSSFLFAIPFESEWTEDLDRITLTGPEGSTTLDRNTGGRAALIIDRASGRVRTISRGWPVGIGTFPAAMSANAQVEIIRGLPSR